MALVYKKSLNKAIEYYNLAAEGGNDKAQYNLALIYDNGIGVPRDYKKAVELYKLSAENDYPPAQNAYGWCFVIGKVVKQDLYQAVR